MTLKEHCLQEFKAAGWLDDPVDDMQQMVMDNILEIVEVFAKQGHSGSSAPYVVNCLNKLLRYETLVPLTGEDDEWFEHDGGLFQNKRNGAVFKQADRFDGRPYYLDGRVFRTPDGCCYTNADSRVVIESFPYTLETVYVDVAE